jgi:hypothetical protein
MKTLKNILAAFTLVILSSTAFAGNGGASELTALMSNVKSHFSSVSHKSGEAKKVTFTFTVNEKGNVNAVSANVSNTEDRKALETQFSKLTFAKLAQGVTYSMDINFINY